MTSFRFVAAGGGVSTLCAGAAGGSAGELAVGCANEWLGVLAGAEDAFETGAGDDAESWANAGKTEMKLTRIKATTRTKTDRGATIRIKPFWERITLSGK
jgi:hypothetical protein